jgi:hypothetical protein
MKRSRFGAVHRPAVFAVSRRVVLSRGAQALALLALPPFAVRKAWGQAAAVGFNYYISPTGSDKNPGTLAAPWALTSCQNNNPNNALMAGKRTGFLPGTYNIGSMQSGTQAGNFWYSILSPPAGSASAQTYWGSSDASGNYSPRTATIVGPGGGVANGLMGPDLDAGHVTIDGFVLNCNNLDTTGANGGGHGIQWYGSTGSYTSGGTTPGIVVQNCEVYGIAAVLSAGSNLGLIWGNSSSGAIVQNNYLHNALMNGGSQPDHVHCYEEYGCQGTQFINNTCINSTTGVDVKAGNSGTVIAYNYFYNVGLIGPAVIQGVDGAEGNANSPGTPYLIHNNIFDSCGASHLGDINNLCEQNCYWWNNTIYNTQSGTVRALDLRTTSSAFQTEGYNNIIVCTANGAGQGNAGTAGSYTPGGYTTVDYNCYFLANYAAAWSLGNNNYETLGAWQAAAGADAHAITSNPQFAAAITPGGGAAQFELAAGSPCKNAGRSNGTTSGAVCDMGAWGNGATQVGCNFALGSGSSTSNPIPLAPKLSVT